MSRLEPRPGYEVLARILDDALEQAQTGKGAKRHAEPGQEWTEQVWHQISCELGHGFPAGQVAKKLAEAWRLPMPQRRWELLGVINYAAHLVELSDEEDRPV